MDFTRLSFLVLLAATAILWRVVPARWRVALLVAVSYGVYVVSNPKKSILLAAVTLAAYAAAKAIGSAADAMRRRLIMAAFVCAVVALLAFFKANQVWHVLPATLLMPLGISYYTFKLISYVVDVYWGTLPAESSFLSLAAYAAFFPQIFAGPIQRAGSFLAQIHNPKPARTAQIMLGIQRILLGYFKKFVVADSLGLLVNTIYANLHQPGTPLLAAFYLYPLQLYADFSGITDIAIGAAWMMGIETPENFNLPFFAASISEFWRRWHITLTCWLTDYVFTPLHMSIRDLGTAGLVLSLFVNMVLIGLWHGFRWTFAVFGIIHAVYLSIDALTARRRRRFYKANPAAARITDWIGPVVTFHMVALAMVFFRADAVADALQVLRGMWTIPARWSPEIVELFDWHGRAILAGLCAYPVMECAEFLRRRNQKGELVDALPRWGRWSVYWCTCVTLLIAIMLLDLSAGERNPFVYAIF